MKSVRLMGARFDPVHQRIEVIKSITNDDDTVEFNLHSISVDALEWKSAELGSMDINELLDNILYEPFVDHNDPRDMNTKTKEIKQTKTDKSITTKSVQKVLLQQAGIGQVYVDAIDNDTYEVLTQNSYFDSESIEVKTAYLVKASKSTLAEKLDVPRLEKVKRALSSSHERTVRDVSKKSSVLKTIELRKGRRHNV